MALYCRMTSVTAGFQDVSVCVFMTPCCYFPILSQVQWFSFPGWLGWKGIVLDYLSKIKQRVYKSLVFFLRLSLLRQSCSKTFLMGHVELRQKKNKKKEGSEEKEIIIKKKKKSKCVSCKRIL